jgi:hypothetical protein
VSDTTFNLLVIGFIGGCGLVCLVVALCALFKRDEDLLPNPDAENHFFRPDVRSVGHSNKEDCR